MERRDFIGTAILTTTGLALSTLNGAPAFAQEGKGAKTPSSKATQLSFQSPDAIKELSSFAEVTSRCALKGELCMHHCDERLANGEKEFSNCNVSARQMVIICDAASKLASMNSVRIKEILDACTEACHACKDACDEHKAHWAHGMHLDCKESAEQCEKTILAVSKLKKVLSKSA